MTFGPFVIPAKAGIQRAAEQRPRCLDSRFRGNDGPGAAK